MQKDPLPKAQLEHELLLLMVNVTQLKQTENILKTFLEAANTLVAPLRLHHLKPGEPEPHGGVLIQINTIHNDFGTLHLQGDLKDYSETWAAFWHNTGKLLALALENAHQRKLLASEAKRLEDLVGERTRDLEEKNQALEAQIQQTAETEAKAATYLEAAPVAMFVANPDGSYADANPAACALTGFSREELLKKNLREMVSPSELALTLKLFETLKKEGQIAYHTLLLQRSGAQVPIQLHAAALPDGRYIAYCNDFTERRQFERNLLAAKRKAEAANQAKSVFLSTMSHELRTPMNGVLAMADILRLSALDEEQKEQVEVIIHSGRSLVAILSDILEISRIEAGRLELELGEFSLLPLIERSYQLFESAMRAKGLQFKLVLAPGLAPLYLGDARRIEQVLRNLIGNAVKFSDQGQVTLRVKVLATAHQGQSLHFEVEDQGPGIEPAAQEYIFDNFRQIDGSSTRKHGGTGLGLAIVRGLLRKMGSDIQLKSQPGQGSVFSFDLDLPFPPSARSASPETLSEQEQLEHSKSLAERFESKRCLLVEDDRTNQFVMGQALKHLGFEVLLAENGQQAVEMVAGETLDLVLMDLVMPQMDGIEATLKIRQQFDANALPIIGVTAQVTGHTHKDCLAVGMNAYLSKPIQTKDLFREITRFVEPNPA